MGSEKGIEWERREIMGKGNGGRRKTDEGRWGEIGVGGEGGGRERREMMEKGDRGRRELNDGQWGQVGVGGGWG